MADPKVQSLASHERGILVAQRTMRVFAETLETAGWAPGASACRRSSCSPLLVGVEARNVPAVGPLVQHWNESGHERELPLAAFPPAKFERRHQVGELLAVEDHALEDGVDEARERLGRQTVVLGEVGDLLGLLLGLEPLVAGANCGLVEAFTLLERADVLGDLFPFVKELGVGLDQPDELFTADLNLLRVLSGVLGDQLHDVVVVDDGGGEEDEFEFELVGRLVVTAGRALLLFQALGGFEVDAAEGAEVVLGEDLANLLALLVGEVGVLVELGLEALDLLEPLDELGSSIVAHQVVHLIWRGFEALRLHKLAEVGDGLLEVVDDDGCLVDQPDLAGPVSLCTREESDGGFHAVLLLAEVEDVAVGLGRVENAVGAGEGLDQAVVLEVLVDVERVEVHGVEAGEEHVDDYGDVDLLGALVGQVAVGELLVLDALLDVLVVEVEVVDVVVRAVPVVVVGDYGL